MSTTEKYTPTTEHVREDFAYPWEGHAQDRPARLEAFDRWKAENDRRIAESAWDLCLSTIEAFELNTEQSRAGNPYRAETEGARK